MDVKSHVTFFSKHRKRRRSPCFRRGGGTVETEIISHPKVLCLNLLLVYRCGRATPTPSYRKWASKVTQNFKNRHRKSQKSHFRRGGWKFWKSDFTNSKYLGCLQNNVPTTASLRPTIVAQNESSRLTFAKNVIFDLLGGQSATKKILPAKVTSDDLNDSSIGSCMQKMSKFHRTVFEISTKRPFCVCSNILPTLAFFSETQL